MDNNQLLKTRIKRIGGSAGSAGSCVLYVMSRDQRVLDNHALLAAQKHAIAKKVPLAVLFCLLPKTGNRAREHYEFMLEGLKEVEKTLAQYNIPFLMTIGDPIEKILAVLHHTKPDAVYFDFSPLRGPMHLQETISKVAKCAVYVVDTHNIVPVWVASQERQVGAYTLRPKLHKLLSTYIQEPDLLEPHVYSWPGNVQKIDELQSYINEVLELQNYNGSKISIVPGESSATAQLEEFITSKLELYGTLRNDPSQEYQSGLSPYLHFGHISSLRIALRLQKISAEMGKDLHLVTSSKMPKTQDYESAKLYSSNALLEELIVRKELADNFCYYAKNYDSLESATQWARQSLLKHASDTRQYVYSYDQLASAQTHDPAWNAAQNQLTSTGKMHGYMRMYWAKKVLEWAESPQQALDFLVKLNDFYSIDGGDPNGYTGILWSIGGVHDRPWAERPVFGVIRYMNYEGLKRKFDISAYESKIF